MDETNKTPWDDLADAIRELRDERDDLVVALELILPLAKGYAAANKVGSNAAYVAAAEAALAKAQPPSDSPEGEG